MEFKDIKIKDIEVKPQVRKSFDEESIKEMVESIKEHGVLQPIAVNQVGKKLFLIYGERRFRAASEISKQNKKNDTIPAIVYTDLPETEVLQMQVIENLQRKDVHPMEEATAYFRMNYDLNMTVEQISKKVSKHPRYVAARLKLNDLIDQFANAFRGGKMSLQDAMEVAKFSKESQEEIWEHYSDDDEIEIRNYHLREAKRDLDKAPFDINDKKLIKNIGACTSCQKNTAVNTLLFPDMESKSQCMDSACYALKENIGYQIALKAAKEDPEVIFVKNYGNLSPKEKEAAESVDKVYEYNEIRFIEPPDEVNIEEFKENLEDGYYDDEAEMNKEIDEAKKEYEEELAQYNDEIKTCKKAFVISGNNKGKIVYVSFRNQNGTAKEVKEKQAAGQVTHLDLQNEITRMENSEARKKELDQEKAWPQKYALLYEYEEFEKNDKALSNNEKIAMIIALSERLAEADDVLESEGCEDLYGDLKMFNWLGLNPKKIDPILNRLSRLHLFNAVQSGFGNSEKSNKCAAIEEVAREYRPDDLDAINLEITNTRQVRETKLQKAIEKIKKDIEKLGTKKK